MEIIGWIGACLLALCGAPQAWTCFKQGHGRGLDATFLWTWGVGCVLMLGYVLAAEVWKAPLIFNYALNVLFVGLMIRYKYWPRSIK